MKYVIVVLVAIIGLTSVLPLDRTQDEKKRVKEGLSKKCVEETSVDTDLFVNWLFGEGDLEEEPKLNAYFLCSNKEKGYQKENGDFDIDAFMEHVQMPGADAATLNAIRGKFEKCAVKKDTPEKSAFNVVTCLFRNPRV